MGRAPGRDFGAHGRGVAWVAARRVRGEGGELVVIGVDGLRNEARHERHHDDAAILGHVGENRVGDVARVVDERARGGVREDHGRRGDVEGGAHRARRYVREIDEHAEPVHLAHDLASKWRKAVVLRGVERRVGPIERDVVGERHVTRAQGVVGAEQIERVLNGVSALEAEHARNPAVSDRGMNGVRRRRPLELGIARHDAAGDVDLLELHARVPGPAGDGAVRLVDGVGALTGDVHGPELSADVPRLEAREVGHARRAPTQVIGFDVHRVRLVLANAPGQVVVPVDDRLRGQDANGAGQVGISALRLLGVERREGEYAEGD